MHIVPFTLKRAHLVSHRLLQPFAKEAELTPARFDLLFVLERNGYTTPFQFLVARWLGVSRATVCKMIRGLQDAGMVTLSVDPANRRRRRISLTPFGRRCFARLDKARLRGRIAGAVRFAWRTANLSRVEVRLKMFEITEYVGRYSRGLREHVSMHGNNRVRGYGYD